MTYVSTSYTEQARQHSRQDLASHKLSPVLESIDAKTWVYRCHKTYPDGAYNSDCAFQVVMRPGLLVFTGDLGTLVLEPRSAETNPLAWLASSYPSWSYIFEKVPQELRKGICEWHNDLALLAAQDYETQARETDNPDLRARCQAVASDIREEEEVRGWDTAEQFIQWLSEADPAWAYCDYPVTEQFTYRAHYQVEALLWLCRKLNLAISEPLALGSSG